MRINVEKYIDPLNSFANFGFNPYEGDIPPDNFVVSYSQDGSPLSYYGDGSWDRTPYSPNGKTCCLCFSTHNKKPHADITKPLENEIRWFMFLLIFMKKGPVSSNGTLAHYLVVLKSIARYCKPRKMTMKEFFSDEIAFLNCLINEPKGVHYGNGLITYLESLGEKVLGFKPVSPSARKALKQVERECRKKINQFSPIPSGIYSFILSKISAELVTVNAHLDKLIELYVTCSNDRLIGRGYEAQSTLKTRLGLKKTLGSKRTPRKANFPQLLENFDLKGYWKSTGRYESIAGLWGVLTETMMLSCLQIQAFTGMRVGEVQLLPFDCIPEQISLVEGKHYLINGYTTKSSNGKLTPGEWVTCDSAILAIKIMQKIARAVYEVKGEDPLVSREGQQYNRLFITPSKKIKKNFQSPSLSFSTYKNLKSRILPILKEQDIVELEQIDPHRAWRSEAKFQVGQQWYLSTHQLRRSLALYAQRSGLVTLPTLKRQLKHITNQMVSYYSKGSEAAKNIIAKDKDHFAKEWQETQPLSEFLSYVLNVLVTDQELFGTHVDILRRDSASVQDVIFNNRQKTIDRFNKGEIAYQETLLGGCTKVGPCDKNPIDLLHINCLTSHCKNLVGSKEKLIRVVDAETNLVNRLKLVGEDTPMYRHEKANLEVLKNTLAVVSKKA